MTIRIEDDLSSIAEHVALDMIVEGDVTDREAAALLGDGLTIAGTVTVRADRDRDLTVVTASCGDRSVSHTVRGWPVEAVVGGMTEVWPSRRDAIVAWQRRAFEARHPNSPWRWMPDDWAVRVRELGTTEWTAWDGFANPVPAGDGRRSS